LGLKANTGNLDRIDRIDRIVISAFPYQKQLVVLSQLLQEAGKEKSV
jgi:hypothetical protein